MQRRYAVRVLGCAALIVAGVVASATGCGSKLDLIIGRNTGAGNPEGGATNGGASGGPGATPDCGAPTAVPAADLLHRYSFDGTGWVAQDSVSAENGQLLNIAIGDYEAGTDAGTGAVQDGSGWLLLDGKTGYVNLPNTLISTLSEVTFVAWVKWTGGAGFQRIFDFGIGVAEDDTSNQGQSYLALSPSGTASRLQVLAKGTNTPEVKLTSSAELNDGNEHQVAVVFVSSAYMELYRDGQQFGRTAIPFSLSSIVDVNDWIGRSQWKDDNRFQGSVDELRIYGRALTACEIQTLSATGPRSL